SAQWRAWSICSFLECSCPCPLIRWRSHHTLHKGGVRTGGLSNLEIVAPVMPLGGRRTSGAGEHALRLAACVPQATLPNVPDMNWQNVMRPAAGECSRI